MAMAAATLPRRPGSDVRAPRTAAERDAMLAALDGSHAWPDAAASLLAELGFRLTGPEGTGRSTWHLLIALRDAPTLRHFDPEQISYYAPAGPAAAIVSVDRKTSRAIGIARSMPALWGHVHVVDRVPVENRFLTFGGKLRVATVGPGLTVVDLSSPAPIVRWGGHSQGTEDLATAIGAFFGRLIVPIESIPGAEASVAAAPPDVLYRAFLADGLRRAAAVARRGEITASALDEWMVAAWNRARRDVAACDAAERLLRRLRLDQ
jgi:hypothetical protein